VKPVESIHRHLLRRSRRKRKLTERRDVSEYEEEDALMTAMTLITPQIKKTSKDCRNEAILFAG